MLQHLVCGDFWGSHKSLEFHLSHKPGYYDLDIKSASDLSSSCKPHRILSGAALADYYISLIEKYPSKRPISVQIIIIAVISIEDPFDQDDWDSWSLLTAKATPRNVQIVADDLTVTNPKRIQTAIDRKACTALLLKVNQIGTLTESLEA